MHREAFQKDLPVPLVIPWFSLVDGQQVQQSTNDQELTPNVRQTQNEKVVMAY